MDWNNIPEDLLDLILSNLLGKDNYSFSLVCRSWNRVARASPYNDRSPCLMTFNQRSTNLWKCFQHNAFFRMNFAALLKDAVVRFSSDGWLLMMSSDKQTLFFFDPFNNQTIELPPILSRYSYTTICFFHPPTSPDCLVIGIVSITRHQANHEWKIGVLRYGEDRWESKILCDRNHQFNVSFGPPVLHNGKVFFLDGKGNVPWFSIYDDDDTWSFIIYPRCFTKRRLRRGIKEHFLIKPKNEKTIFGVFVVHDERKVRVFQLIGLNHLRAVWKPVEDLCDMVFYVSKTSSFGYKTDDKTMANKIFFPKFHDNKIVFYSMDTQKYHSFEGDYSSNASYDCRRFDLAPWIIPTLHQKRSREFTSSTKLTWSGKVDETTT